MLSYNEPQFIAEVLRNLWESIGARTTYNSPYYPQGNSVCESFMTTLKKALSTLASEDECDWDVHLQAVAFAHNATPHTSTSHSPFFLVHGRERRYFRFKGTWIHRGWTPRRGEGLLDCWHRGYAYTKLTCKRLEDGNASWRSRERSCRKE